MDGIYVVVQGVTITSSPLPISINSPDMNGDLSVDLIDVGQFAAAITGSYNPCADFFKNDLRCQRTAICCPIKFIHLPQSSSVIDRFLSTVFYRPSFINHVLSNKVRTLLAIGQSEST